MTSQRKSLELLLKCWNELRRRAAPSGLWAAILLLACSAALLEPQETGATQGNYEIDEDATAAGDLLAEMCRRVFLEWPDCRPHAGYEYLIVEGTVVALGVESDPEHDWDSSESFYPGWGTTTIDPKRVQAIGMNGEVTEGPIQVVERLAWYRNGHGTIAEASFGTKSELHNRMQLNDKVVVVAIRPVDADTTNALYAPLFWPRFSVVFSVYRGAGAMAGVLTNATLVPSSRQSVGQSWSRLGPEEVNREFHMYDVRADEAFELLVDHLTRGGDFE